MKRTVTILAGLLMAVLSLSAQDFEPADTVAYVLTDSLVYIPTANLDTALVGKSIYDILPTGKNGNEARVTIHQSESVSDGFREHLSANKSKTVSGYRVRIFFDNSQDARVQSERTLNTFKSSFPGVPAYRSYTNPFFKVTVGDFRTRSEAMQLLQQLKGIYPSAFIVKENIEYPVVDKHNSYIVDTLQVRKYILPK